MTKSTKSEQVNKLRQAEGFWSVSVGHEAAWRTEQNGGVDKTPPARISEPPDLITWNRCSQSRTRMHSVTVCPQAARRSKIWTNYNYLFVLFYFYGYYSMVLCCCTL